MRLGDTPTSFGDSTGGTIPIFVRDDLRRGEYLCPGFAFLFEMGFDLFEEPDLRRCHCGIHLRRMC